MSPPGIKGLTKKDTSVSNNFRINFYEVNQEIFFNKNFAEHIKLMNNISKFRKKINYI